MKIAGLEIWGLRAQVMSAPLAGLFFTVIVIIDSCTIITMIKFGISGTNMILLSPAYRDVLIMEASRRACSLGG